MAFKGWDNREYWEDDSKCVVCGADMGKSLALICSATCEDISLYQESQSYPFDDNVENDCYA